MITPEPWEHYEYEGTIDDHVEWYREKLEQGLRENPQDGPIVVHFVGTPDLERTICVVGNGPSSRDNARFIAQARRKESETFTERQLEEIKFALMYEGEFAHGTPGHNHLMLIAKLARHCNHESVKLFVDRPILPPYE